MYRLLGLVLIGTTLLVVSPSQGQSNQPVRASDVLQVNEIREVHLSPSGRTAAYVVRTADNDSLQDGPTAYRTHLYAVPASGRDAPRLLTRSEKGVGDPAWHPDGDLIAFVRPVDRTPQVFVLSLSGGEPYQLTDFPYGATNPQWSPSGDRLLISSSVPESYVRRQVGRLPVSERPGRSMQDTMRHVPPDTLLVLRHAHTLDPVDTLSLGPDGRPRRLPDDTTEVLRTPDGVPIPEEVRTLPADTLRTLPPDTVRAVFERLRVLPDTTTVPVPPDTVATPNGDLLQVRRWMEQRPSTETQVFRRTTLHENDKYAPVPSYRHYFLVDIPQNIVGGRPDPPSATPVTKGFRSFNGAVWLPGGTQLVVSAPPRSSTHPDRVQKRNLYTVNVETTSTQRLLTIDGYSLTAPRLTSNGTTIAFRARPHSPSGYGQTDIGLFELDGRSAPKLITEDFDRTVSSHRWSPDGWYLYATARSRIGRPLYRFAPFAQDDTTDARAQTSLREEYSTSRDTFALDSTMVDTATHEQMTRANRVIQAFDVTDSRALYALLSPENPSELFANAISFNNEQRLSSHNADWVEDRRISESEPVTAWNEGLSVEGRVTGPLTGSRAPLLVVPRGGPPQLYRFDPVANWFERQYLAGRGYGVVEAWPRGSDGYGTAFQKRNFQNWGPGPAGDVLAVADTALARSWADSTRQLIAGRSYGGFLTAWLVSRTNRFDAAVAQSGVYDLISFFGVGDAWRLVPEQFGGFPWETAAPSPLHIDTPTPLLSVGLLPQDTTESPLRALRRNSPITRAHHITTPLLLLHGGDDHQVGPAQADMLYRRLKVLERPVEYARYPGVGHDFSNANPRQRLDRLVRLYEFMARFARPMGPSPSTATPSP